MSNWSFIEYITKSFSNQRVGDPKAPTLWPSEASAIIEKNGKKVVVGKCRRSTFFRYLLENISFYEEYETWKNIVEEIKGKTLPIDKYLIWIWRQGELYEEYLIEQAKISGVFLGTQIPLYFKKYNLSGKEDIEVINPETAKTSIVESKSVYGHNAKYVLGHFTKNGYTPGTPKDSNLMQIGLYHYKRAMNNSEYEESRLVYGSRDTGKYGEYLIKTEKGSTGQTHIFYKMISPRVLNWVESPITIESILEQYQYITECLNSFVIPERDYNIIFSEEELAELYEEDELTKTERVQYEKVIARREENNDRIANGLKPKQELKQVEKGHWNCSLCQYRNVCYEEDNTPREI